MAFAAEGSTGCLRNTLDQSIVELRGGPLPLLRKIATGEAGVEDVRVFGDRLHMRVQPGKAAAVIQNVKKSIPAGGGVFSDARSVAPSLEDVFMALSQDAE